MCKYCVQNQGTKLEYLKKKRNDYLPMYKLSKLILKKVEKLNRHKLQKNSGMNEVFCHLKINYLRYLYR